MLLVFQLISCGPSEAENQREREIAKRKIELAKQVQWSQEAKKPLEALGKLEAKIEIGISCRSYREEVGIVNYQINEFLSSKYSGYDPSFNSLLLQIRDIHKDVSILWDCDDPEWNYDNARFDANSIDTYHKKFWDVLNRNGLTKFKNEGGVRFYRETNWQQYDFKLAIDILWKNTSKGYLTLKNKLNNN